MSGDVKGCELPAQLFYHIENNVWVRLGDDGLITLGMTAYACSLSGEVVSITTKRTGKSVKQQKTCATVESGKWVGPIRAPVSGEIVAINQLVVEQPAAICDDPYGSGWLLRMRPDDWAGESNVLQTGENALRAFAQKMENEGFGGC